jgi:hypothetical protein
MVLHWHPDAIKGGHFSQSKLSAPPEILQGSEQVYSRGSIASLVARVNALKSGLATTASSADHDLVRTAGSCQLHGSFCCQTGAVSGTSRPGLFSALYNSVSSVNQWCKKQFMPSMAF